jgi:hypothetical protein
MRARTLSLTVVCAVLVTLSAPLAAQDAGFGARSGVAMGGLSGLDGARARPGVSIGPTFGLHVTRWLGVQAELLYTTYGAWLSNVTALQLTGDVFSQASFRYLQLPFLARLNIGALLHSRVRALVYGGPHASAMLQCRLDVVAPMAERMPCGYASSSVPFANMGTLAFGANWAPGQRRPDLSGQWMIRDTTAWRALVSDSLTADTTRDTTSIIYTIPLAGGGRMHVRRTADPDPGSPRYQHFQLLRAMAQPARAFTIAQTDSSVTVTNQDGLSYTVSPGGDKTVISVTDSIVVEAHAKWDDGALVIEYRPTGGGTVTESYYLADSRQYLRVEVLVDYKDYTRLYGEYWRSRMYRRVDAGGP